MLKRTTLEDVARAASVSKTTASMVLNGKGANKIMVATRQRVLAAASELQFRPHGVARALKRQRADVLGVVCTLNPFVELAHHAFEQSLLSALFHHVLEAGYNPMIYGLPEADAPEEILFRYADGRSDGFILLYPEPDSVLLARLPQLGLPVTPICCRVDGTAWVDSDHEGGIAAAVEHLAMLGHRRIGYLINADVDRFHHVRVEAFRRTLQRLGLPLQEAWIACYESEHSALEAQLACLLHSSERPTALLTWNDVTAADVYKFVHGLRLRIPADLSIVGFDDVASARNLVPALTTIRQDVGQMAQTAVAGTLLALAVAETVTLPQGVTCPVHLIVRQSTAGPPKAES